MYDGTCPPYHFNRHVPESCLSPACTATPQLQSMASRGRACVLESADRQSAWEDLPNLCYTTLTNASKIATCGRCAAGTEYTPATLNPQNMKCFNTRMYYSASDLCQGSRLRGLSPIAPRPLLSDMPQLHTSAVREYSLGHWHAHLHVEP